MTTPSATPTPTAPGAPSPAATDQALADRCQSSGDYIAGLLAAGHLEAASTVTKMPAAMFPDWPADMVQAVWDAALAVGFQAGRVSVRPTWAPEALTAAGAALDKAGYTAMGRLAARSAALHPRHPADTKNLAAVRDGGHP